MSIPQIAFCTGCGGSIPDDARFCPYCGRPAPERTPARAVVTEAGPPGEVPLVALPTGEAQVVNERVVVAGALSLIIGVVLGVCGLFPAYSGGLSLVHQQDVLSLHALDLFGWAVAGIVLLLSTRVHHAAYATLAALGISIVAFGYYFTDLATALTVPGESLGAGYYLGLVGWLAALVGSILAARALARVGALGKTTRPKWLSYVVCLAVLGATVFYAPSWDRFVIDIAATHRVVVLTEGNAFSNPGLVIFASLVVMATMLAVGALAALRRPGRQGAALLAGMLVPVLGEVLAGFVQWTEPVPLSQFGITPAEVATDHITAWMGFTWIFDLEVAFVAALVVCVVVLFRAADERQR